MMFNYPYFGSPSYNRYSRYGYRYPSYYSQAQEKIEPVMPPTQKNTTFRNTNYFNKQGIYSGYPHKETVNTSKNHTNTKCNTSKEKEEKVCQDDDDDVLFEFFGIKLHFDDILIICLLLFLYMEGVKDQGLFISLIMLLLS